MAQEHEVSRLQEKGRKVQVRFCCRTAPDVKKVFLAGDFNGWDPAADRMQKRNGVFVKRIHLLPGEHQYKFVADGEWIEDAAAESQAPNEFGARNSVLIV